MSRIAVDMDEVMADTLAHQLTWLATHHGYRLTPADLHDRKPHDAVDPAHVAALEATMHGGDFFADIPPMAGAIAGMRTLCARHEVFVATAAMDYPYSCRAKYDWLRRHFPFIDAQRFVFCGDKAVVHADFLVDDSARHFARFVGTGLLFDAPHNREERGYERLRSWDEVVGRLE